jgi:GNAT superfamily N-acetyltransferase
VDDVLSFRPAQLAEIGALNALIRESAAALSRGFYSDAEIAAAIEYVFGVDSQLVRDGTYFVGEIARERVACGGWSRRGALYGGDQRRMGEAPLLDPATEPARIRAFFVHPRFARRGIGRRLLDHCAEAAQREGYRALELMATLPGVPLYASCGFAEIERVRDRMPNGVELPFVRMRKELASP